MYNPYTGEEGIHIRLSNHNIYYNIRIYNIQKYSTNILNILIHREREAKKKKVVKITNVKLWI